VLLILNGEKRAAVKHGALLGSLYAITPSECGHKLTDWDTGAYGSPLRSDMDFRLHVLDMDDFFLATVCCFCVHSFLPKS
jgi:hypothetical protein